MTKIKAILFDLDGTLVDSAPDLIDSLKDIMSQQGLDVSDITLKNLGATAGFGARKIIHQGYQLAGHNLDQAQVDALLTLFISRYQQNIAVDSTIFPGAIAALTTLQRQGVALAICTNKTEKLARLLLNELNLTHFFKAIIGGDSTQNKKPHPQPLLTAAKLLGVNAENCVMIGDTPIDEMAAKAAGMPFIAFNSHYHEFTTKPITINSFHELAATLNQI